MSKFDTSYKDERSRARWRRVKLYAGYTLALGVPTSFVFGALYVMRGWDKAIIGVLLLWIALALIIEGIALILKGGK